MLELHCQRCGGLSGNPAGTTYPEASTTTPPVPPRSGPCVCGDPVVYGPAPEPSLWELQGGGVHRIRSASRN
jgi:hypothetical protein